jgi:hypothetical protein
LHAPPGAGAGPPRREGGYLRRNRNARRYARSRPERQPPGARNVKVDRMLVRYSEG